MIEKKRSRIVKDKKDTKVKSISPKKSLFFTPEEMEEGINKIMGIMNESK